MAENQSNAIQKFNTLVKLQPENPDAHFKLGLAYEEAGQFTDATRSFEHAIKLNSSHALALFHKGFSYSRGGELELALESWEKGIEADSSIHQRFTVPEHHAMYSKHIDNSLQAFLSPTVVNPKSSYSHYQLGVCYKCFNRPELAIQSLKTALEVNEDLWEAHAQCGEIYAILGQNRLAIDSFLRALSINNKAHSAHYKLAQVYDQENMSAKAQRSLEQAIHLSPDNPFYHYAMGRIYMKHGQYKKAMSQYQKALDRDPRNPKVHLALADCCNHMYRPDLALKCYEKASTLDPSSLKAVHQLGSMAFQLGKNDKAIESFNKAIELDPNDPYVHYNLAQAYERSDNLDKAIEHYEKSFEINNKDAFSAYNLGLSYQKKEDLGQAIHWFEKAYQLNKQDSKYQLALGQALIENKEFEKSADYVKGALELNPNDIDTNFLMADVYMRMKQVDSAIGLYGKVAKLSPDNAEVHRRLGRAFTGLKMYDYALESYQNAVKIDPKNSESLIGMGRGYLHAKKKPSLAIDYFNQALDIDAGNTEVLKDLATAYQQSDQTQKGIEVIEQAFEDHGDQPELVTLYAQLMTEAGEIDKAIDKLKSSLLQDPENIGSRSAYAQLLASQESWSEAALEQRKASVLAPKDIGHLLWLGYYQEKAQETEAAKESYNKILKLHSGHPTATTRMAVLFGEANEPLSPPSQLPSSSVSPQPTSEEKAPEQPSAPLQSSEDSTPATIQSSPAEEAQLEKNKVSIEDSNVQTPISHDRNALPTITARPSTLYTKEAKPKEEKPSLMAGRMAAMQSSLQEEEEKAQQQDQEFDELLGHEGTGDDFEEVLFEKESPLEEEDIYSSLPSSEKDALSEEAEASIESEAQPVKEAQEQGPPEDILKRAVYFKEQGESEQAEESFQLALKERASDPLVFLEYARFLQRDNTTKSLGMVHAGKAMANIFSPDLVKEFEAVEAQIQEQKSQPSVQEPEVAQETEPEVAQETEPEVAQEAEPEVAQEIEPEVAQETEPEVAEEIEPEVAQEIEPEVAQEIEPEVAQEIEPETVQEIEPEVAQEIEPEVAQEIEPEVAQEIEPETVQEIEPEVAQETESEVAEETEPEVAQETEPEVAEETEPEVAQEAESEVAQEIEPETVQEATSVMEASEPEIEAQESESIEEEKGFIQTVLDASSEEEMHEQIQQHLAQENALVVQADLLSLLPHLEGRLEEKLVDYFQQTLNPQANELLSEGDYEATIQLYRELAHTIESTSEVHQELLDDKIFHLYKEWAEGLAGAQLHEAAVAVFAQALYSYDSQENQAYFRSLLRQQLKELEEQQQWDTILTYIDQLIEQQEHLKEALSPLRQEYQELAVPSQETEYSKEISIEELPVSDEIEIEEVEIEEVKSTDEAEPLVSIEQESPLQEEPEVSFEGDAFESEEVTFSEEIDIAQEPEAEVSFEEHSFEVEASSEDSQEASFEEHSFEAEVEAPEDLEIDRWQDKLAEKQFAQALELAREQGAQTEEIASIWKALSIQFEDQNNMSQSIQTLREGLKETSSTDLVSELKRTHFSHIGLLEEDFRFEEALLHYETVAQDSADFHLEIDVNAEKERTIIAWLEQLLEGSHWEDAHKVSSERLPSHRAHVLQMWIATLVEESNFDKAQELSHQLVEIDPQNETNIELRRVVYHSWIEALISSEQLQEATQAREKLLALDPVASLPEIPVSTPEQEEVTPVVEASEPEVEFEQSSWEADTQEASPEESIEIDPQELLNEVQAMLDESKYEEASEKLSVALNHLQEGQEKAPLTSKLQELYDMWSKSLIVEGDFSNASDVLEKAKANEHLSDPMDKEMKELYLAWAEMEQFEQNFEKSSQLYESAIKLSSLANVSEIKAQLADVYRDWIESLASQDSEDSRTLLRKVNSQLLELLPNDQRALERKENLLLEDAGRAEESNRFEEALELYSKLGNEQKPSQVRILEKWILDTKTNGPEELLSELLEKMSTLEPEHQILIDSHKEASYSELEELVEAQKYDAALKELRQAVIDNPDDNPLHELVFKVHELKGQQEGAGRQLPENFYREIHKSLPTEAVHLRNLARAYTRIGKDTLAAVQYRRLLQLDPSVDYHVEIGKAYLRMNKAKEALRHFSNGLGEDSNFVPALAGALLSNLLLDNYEDAKELRDRLVDQSPEQEYLEWLKQISQTSRPNEDTLEAYLQL